MKQFCVLVTFYFINVIKFTYIFEYSGTAWDHTCPLYLVIVSDLANVGFICIFDLRIAYWYW